MINEAYALGIQLITRNRFTPGPVLEILVLASILASMRWLVLAFRVLFGRGPIEVRPLDNASGVTDVDIHKLDVAFRDYLTLPRLYQVTTIPGDPDPDHLIEILKAPTYSGWRGLLAAASAYALPRRAFVVSATLRARDHDHMYGVSVQVRRLPGYATELESQWSTSFERALQRAAYAVSACILPQTRRCRNVPWSDWRGRILPVTLFRDYQRAKKMVGERRYDEALALYRRALLQDANNIGLRYDVGQLYERLRLYPDALYMYLTLVNEIFPARIHAGKADPVRVSKPLWWPERARDPFVIRYRYVVVLSAGAALARELSAPDWRELRTWLIQQARGDEVNGQLEERPWRAAELLDIERLLSREFDLLFPSLMTDSENPGETLLRKITVHRTAAGLHAENAEPHAWDLEEYLLKCAEIEAESLRKDFDAMNSHSIRGLLAGRGSSALTSTAIRQGALLIQYRLRRLAGPRGHQGDGEAGSQWPRALDKIWRDLERAGYGAEASANWLEHYNAACVLALALSDDEKEIKENRKYAYAAVAALERALGSGEDVDFVRAKRYWLQAGDPDLAGLRNYECFRAFEARVYGRPLPATADIAKYELYLYLRTVLEVGAAHLEQEWRKRASRKRGSFDGIQLEGWWREEGQAWELAIRLGRFYPQWQTRRAVLEGLRAWVESLGTEAYPVPYPNLIRAAYLPDIDDFGAVSETLVNTEAIFEFLGSRCGRLRVPEGTLPLTVLGNARAWAEYARECSRLARSQSPAGEEMAAACQARAAVWAALRQWAHSPGDEGGRAFAEAIGKLASPPPANGSS
jgi:hypothetical protein